jgi:signal transduction histidine kinase
LEASSLIEFEIFDPLLDSVVVVDRNFCILYANASFAHMCGSTVRRILRKPRPLSEFLTLEDDFFKKPQLVFDESLAKMYREVGFSSSDGAAGTVQYCIQERTKSANSDPLWVIFLRDVTLEKSLHDKYKLQLQAKEEVIEDLRQAQKKLQEYSEGLEAMVAERTQELREALDFQRATLNCLGQGFFVFDQQGKVLPEYSRVCPEMFGREPAGVHVTDLLRLEGKTLETFNSFLSTVFMDAIPFEDLLELLNLQPVVIDGRTLKVDLYPMRGEDGGLRSVVVVATDISKELLYEEQLGKQKALAERVTQVLKHPNQYLSYVRESEKLLDKMADMAQLGEIAEAQEEVTRGLHTIKGGASSFYLSDFAELVHQAEQKVKAYYGGQSEAFSWEMELGKLKRAFKWCRKEVNDLLGIESRAEKGGVEVPSDVLKRWCRELETPTKASVVSQEIFRDYLCESVEDLLGHLTEETQKLAALLGKKVLPLGLYGNSVRLLPEFYQGVISNLIHCIRNAVDHGLEPEAERVELGKSPSGVIDITVSVVKGKRGRSEVQIVIEDDGRGINEKKLRSKHPKGTLATRDEVLLSIFEDGFSTKDEVTTISGMGVGMSALKAEVEKLGGSVAVESEPLKGTKILLTMPKINSLSDYVGFLMLRPKAS